MYMYFYPILMNEVPATSHDTQIRLVQVRRIMLLLLQRAEQCILDATQNRQKPPSIGKIPFNVFCIDN